MSGGGVLRPEPGPHAQQQPRRRQHRDRRRRRHRHRGRQRLTMIGTTVAGNTRHRTLRSSGGGIGASGENVGIGLINSTLTATPPSATTAPATGGGIYASTPAARHSAIVTIAGNERLAGAASASTAGRRHDRRRCQLARRRQHRRRLPGAVSGDATSRTTTSSRTARARSAATGDIQGVDPPLGALANNGGPTTRARCSPAAPPSTRAATLRRRPTSAASRGPRRACDIGAFEYVAPTLTVTTSVINDNGGSATAVTYRVTRERRGRGRQPGVRPTRRTRSSPARSTSRPRSPATPSASAATARPTGDVVLGENQNKTCTVVANDNALSGSQLPPPVIREKVNMIPARGTIKVKRPGAKRFRKLADDGAQLPVGTTVDALEGRVTIVAASDDGGGTDTAVFYGGIFKIAQTKGDKPTTILSLTEKLSCPKAGNASAAAKEEEAPPVGRRRGQVPHQGQAQRGDRGRYEVARRGPLHVARSRVSSAAASRCATSRRRRRSSSAPARSTPRARVDTAAGAAGPSVSDRPRPLSPDRGGAVRLADRARRASRRVRRRLHREHAGRRERQRLRGGQARRLPAARRRQRCGQRRHHQRAGGQLRALEPCSAESC